MTSARVSSSEPELSLVVPVLNGGKFIAANLQLLDEFLRQNFEEYEILVVDDGSTDNTAHVLQNLELRSVRHITLPRNMGKFGAIGAGMLQVSGRCRMFMDSDLPFRFEVIPIMAKLVSEGGFDVVIGDRSLWESDYFIDLPVLRIIVSRVFTGLIRLLVTGGLFDTQCGVKAFRGDVAAALFPLLTDSGFSGDVELLYVALKYNLAIRRVPVRRFRSEKSTVKLRRDVIPMFMRIICLPSKWRRGVYESKQLRALCSQKYWPD